MFDEFKSGDKGHMALVTEVSNTSVEHSSHYFRILNKKGKVFDLFVVGQVILWSSLTAVCFFSVTNTTDGRYSLQSPIKQSFYTQVYVYTN